MVHRANHEPTMEEIVVALRETHRGAGRSAPFQVVGRRPSGKVPNVVSHAQSWIAGATDAAELRDSETERLLADNARLNERIIFLLKIIEREQTRSSERATLKMDHDALLHDMKGALKAELRPALLVVLRMLEKQVAEPDRMATGDTPSAWIVDLIHRLESDNPGDALHDALLLPQPRPTLRQRLGRFFHALGF